MSFSRDKLSPCELQRSRRSIGHAYVSQENPPQAPDLDVTELVDIEEGTGAIMKLELR